MTDTPRHIRALDHDTINRIAAGEVIENPAGVIRELLDNAIDAGARHIEVRVDFNDFYMEVLDDGCGIHPEEISIAFDKHTTSKITHFEEIYTTSTLGFRGEALASLASVSEVTVETAVADTGAGIRYRIRGNERGKVEIIACNRGTRIRVRDLFFNTPVRKKFLSLRSPGDAGTFQLKPIEKRNIKQEVIRQSLAQDGIDIKLFIADAAGKGKEKLEINIPGHLTLLDKILLFFKSNAHGQPLEKSLLPVRESLNGFHLEGYITDLSIREYRSDKQFLVIKKRVVKEPSFLKAVLTAYLHKLPRGSHPMIFLRVGVDHLDSVDPNVHPRKEQVKFQNRQLFFDAIRIAIKHTLERSFSSFAPSPQSSSSEVSPPREILADSFAETRERFQAQLNRHSPFQKSEAEREAKRAELFPPPNLNSNPETATHADLPLTILGQIADSFILFTLGEDLYLADQHAAHERINFDRILSEMRKKTDTQMLLIPLLIERSKSDLDHILLQQDLLEQLGFEVEAFGQDTLRISRVPAYLPEAKITETIHSLLDMVARRSPDSPLELGSVEHQEFLGNVAARMACRMSVFSGDRLSLTAMEELIREIYRKGYVFTCPHGRPFVKKIPLQEMKLFFDRGRHILGDVEDGQ